MGRTSDAQLRRALGRFCAAARRQHLRPEEALVAFKVTCRSVPEVRDARKADVVDDLIARAVTMWIAEYYAVGDDDRQAVDEGDVSTT